MDPVQVVYHLRYGTVTCQCGNILDERHKLCLTSGKGVEVLICVNNEKNCGLCEEKRKEKEFYRQWNLDSSDNLICLWCNVKCRVSELPKICECTFHIGRDGKRHCKKCDKILLRNEECGQYKGSCA